MSEKKKRGVSPVIATVLLIAMVVVIALIVFLWFRGFSGEAITKFGGTNIELICGDVQFDASYISGILSLSNIGNVPIFGIKAKISSQGSFETKDLRELVGWPREGLSQGGVFSENVDLSADNIVLIPVLRGKSEKGDKTYVCGERYGKEIIT